MIKINMERCLHIVVFILLSLIYYKLFINHLYSFHFVDEEHHLVIGSLINKDNHLFRDLSTNHQPIPFFVSFFTNKIFDFQNIRLLIKYNRFFIFSYSLIWYLIFLFLFKKKGLIFFGLFEFLKYFYFGNMVLAESLVVFPCIIIFNTIFKLLFKSEINFSKFYEILLGLSIFIVIFNLAWLWPFIIGVFILLFIKNKKLFLKECIYLIIFSFVLFIFFINPVDWFRETVWNIVNYTIPEISDSLRFSFLHLLFFPFESIWKHTSVTGFTIYLLLLCNILVFLKNKKNWNKFLIIYVLLFLINNRVFDVEKVYYNGFHLLPWFGSYLFVSILSIDSFLEKFKSRLLLYFVGLVVFVIFFFAFKIEDFWKIDREYQYYVNYSEIDDLNWALKELSGENETMFVTDIIPLAFYKTDLKPIAQQVDYYDWQFKVPYLDNEVKKCLKENPPEFIVGTNKFTNLEFLENYKLKNYSRLKKFNKESIIFVRNDKMNRITQDVWDKILYRGFSK